MNIALRFRRGAGLQLAGNTKTQTGYLKVTNARTDQGDVVSKRPGAIEVSRSTTDEGELPVADLRATWYREQEQLIETKDAVYSREVCDGAVVGGALPNGDWDRRGPWTRGRLRIEETRDFGEVSIVQSTAALVNDANGTGPCVLQLIHLVAADGGPVTLVAVQFAADHDENISGPLGSGQVVTVAAPGRDPHVVRVDDTTLALTWLEGGSEIFYQFWSPGDTFAGTGTGEFRGALDNYDLSGVSVGGVGYYGLIHVDGNNDIRVQVRSTAGPTVTETRAILGAQSNPLAVSIYAIPDPQATDPTFIFAAVALGVGNARVHYVEVAYFDGGALVPIWTSDGAARNREGTPVKITAAALVSSYATIGRIAVQETTAGNDPYTTATDITSGGFVIPSEVLRKRNAIYSSMTELDGQLVIGETAVESNFDRFKRSGLFIQGEPGPEVIASAGFGVVEDVDQEPVRTQVSDTNQKGTLLTVGYQIETGILEPGPVPADEGLTAARIMTLDTESRPNHPAALQGVAVSAHAGYPRGYDGRGPFEQHWHELPHILVVSEDETPGGINAGTYQIAVTWDAYDAEGNFYRTQPDFSQPLDVVGNGVSIGVIFRTLQRTERPFVRAVVWRTLANGTLLYKADSIEATTATVPDDNIVVTLSLGDTSINQNEILDQVLGGTRPSQPTSITDWVAQAGGRLWGADPFRGSLLRFTIPTSEGFSPHWPLVQGVEVEGTARVTAAGAMDGRLVLFTRREAHQLTGAGPSATGVGGFGLPRLIPSAVGCSNHETVALTPDGLVYGSGFTPFILSRSLVTMEYADAVYAPYEIDGEAVRVAVWRPNDRTTVLANGPAGRTLVFSPETLRWEEDTGRQALDLAVSDSREVAWLLGDGRILVEPSVVAGNAPGLDGALGYQLLVSTPWLHWPTSDRITHTTFNFHGVELYGTYQGPHELQVRVYINYQTDPTYELLKSKGDTVTNAANGLPYLYQFLLPAAIACYAVRIEISDNDSPAPTFMLEGIDVEVVGTGDNKPALLPAELGLKKA